MHRRILTSFSLLTVICATAAPLNAQMLKGGVEEEGYRLSHPHTAPPLQGQANDGLRLTRSNPLHASAVDSTAFSGTPETATAATGSPLNGMVNDFAKPPRNFDIGADRGSKEMVLAWEKWHHQLSGAIYERWQRVADERGRATIRVTVSKDRQISAQVINCDGGPIFENEILEAITSLNNNPGLTFPAKSLRQKVSFDADYIADTNVRPGYSWVKNDYEKVRQDY